MDLRQSLGTYWNVRFDTLLIVAKASGLQVGR